MTTADASGAFITPMTVCKYYDIQFVYPDNDQVYNDTVKLNVDELAVVLSALTALVAAGEIRSPDGTDGVDNIIVPYMDPIVLTLDQLKENWAQGSLQDRLDEVGFTWPEAVVLV
jgi:hypothetical protein